MLTTVAHSDFLCRAEDLDDTDFARPPHVYIIPQQPVLKISPGSVEIGIRTVWETLAM